MLEIIEGMRINLGNCSKQVCGVSLMLFLNNLLIGVCVFRGFSISGPEKVQVASVVSWRQPPWLRLQGPRCLIHEGFDWCMRLAHHDHC